MRDWFLAFALVLCVAFLAFHVGEMRGRAKGYSTCVSEYDEDFAPGKRYATGGR